MRLHYSSIPLKRVVRLVNQRAAEAANSLPIISLDQIESMSGKHRPGADIDSSESSLNLFFSGDVIYSKLRPYLVKVVRATAPGRCGSELLVLRPVRIDAGFLHYVCLSHGFTAEVVSSMYGSKMPRTEWGAIGGINVPVPELAVQRPICEFLDRKTAAIDALIQRKERLVELLQEKRQALITQSVTKGLDPTVPMKDSGVEWIGDVPVHWKVARVRQVARLESGHTPSRQHPEWWIPEECTIPWVSLADVWKFRDGVTEYVDTTAEKISEVGLANSSARLLPARTVILSRTASVGFSAIIELPMATTQDFVNWICGPTLLPEYLLYLLRAMTPEFARLTQGSVHRTIYMPDVARFMTTVPPLDEQERIVANVRSELRRLDGLAQRVQAMVDKLREYRQALITAAVTGELEVPADSGVDAELQQLEAQSA